MKIILFVLGLLLGVIITCICYSLRKPSGTFVIDFTDPLKDVCRFELGENLNTIYTKKRIVLNVRTYEDDSLN